MIGRLAGQIVEKNPPHILIEVSGVSYEVDVPMSTFYDLPAVGERCVLLTHFVVREDAQLLYGFLNHTERDAFRQLIKISGVGPRTALSVLSGMSVNDLVQAVTLQDAGRIVKVPGIGKKTAERLLLELKGKLAQALPGASVHSIDSTQVDVINALMALGYSEKEAMLAVKNMPKELSVSAAIKHALQGLSGGR